MYSVKEVAEILGVSVHTVRYYDYWDHKESCRIKPDHPNGFFNDRRIRGKNAYKNIGKQL